MGSKTFNGVRFSAYPDDHPPRHVHGVYAGMEVIVDLREEGAELSDRAINVKPTNAKRSDVKHVILTAANNLNALAALWEEHHGTGKRKSFNDRRAN